jgi:P4 family phage/plasmid primase-like protien
MTTAAIFAPTPPSPAVARESWSTHPAARLISTLFAPSDQILLRPIETWIEDSKKKSRTLYKHTCYSPAASYLFRTAFERLLVAAEQESANLFYGVSPRVGAGGFDKKWQIRTVRCLWADVDNCLPADALVRCAQAGVPAPTAVVSSGNGTHLYWKLSEPSIISDVSSPPRVEIEWIEQRDGKKKKREYFCDPETKERLYLDVPQNAPSLSGQAMRIEDTLTGIAAAIGGDSTQDLSRLLRLPGTLNRKDQRNGRDPTPCDLVSIEPERTYLLADFEKFIAQSSSRKHRIAVAAVRLPAIRRSLGTRKQDKLNDLINISAVAQAGERSERDFDLCCFCLRNGIAAPTAWPLMQGVGKFAEKGEAYFVRTWARAEQQVREHIYGKLIKKEIGKRPGANGHAKHKPPPGIANTAANGTFNGAVNGTAKHPGHNEPADATAALPIESEEDPHRLARLFLAEQSGRVLYWHRDYYRWSGTSYRQVDDAEIEGEITAAIKREFDRLNLLDQEDGITDEDGSPKQCRHVTAAKVNNVIRAVRSLTVISSEIQPPVWLVTVGQSASKSCIPFANGLVDLKALLAGDGLDRVLLPHTPDYFCLWSLPYDFDPAAECPRWTDTLSTNQEHDEKRIAILQEWAGYMLLPDTSEQKFVILEGEGANGKSVYCAGIEAMLGLENCCHVSLENFGQRFALTSTIHKLANIVPDCGEIDRVAEGFLKSFTAGDRMTFDRKGKPAVEAFPTARMMIATNNRPRFGDRSGGLWRRMILVPWRRKVSQLERIKGMDKPEYWQASGELPGIFAWAVAGLARLREQGAFTRSELVDEGLDDYRRETNPARSFLQQFVREVPDHSIGCTVLYSHYANWCKLMGYHKINENNFGREVNRIFKKVETKQCREGGERYRRYEGIVYEEEIFDEKIGQSVF